jgi:hypothetical protein
MVKVFNIVGVSRVRVGFPLKFRVANGKPAARARTLERAGCVDIQLFQTEAMNKMKALAWFEVNHPELAAQIGNKQVQAVKAKAPVVAEEPVVALVVEEPAKVEVVDVALSAAAKLAVKRAKDAARKREKRAAEKAAKLAAVA